MDTTSTTAGYQAAITLRNMLMGIPYLLCAVGIIESVWKNDNKPKAILNSVLITFIIVALIYGFHTGLEELKNGFVDLREKFSEVNTFEKLYSTAAGKAPSKWSFDYLCYLGVIVLKKLGYFSVFFLEWLQEFAINGLIAVSPILLGFLATSFTRSIGINFLMTSLAVVMWQLGFCIVDLVFYHFSGQILAASGLSAVASGTALTLGAIGWPLALAGMLLIVIVSNVFYLSVPILVQALLKGANPATTVLAAGVQGTATAVGMAVGAKFALGQMNSQQMATATPSSTQSGTDGMLNKVSSSGNQSVKADSFTNSSGISSNDSSQGMTATESGTSSIPSPPSTKPFTAKAGESFGHAGYTATQTSPEKFTLSNNKTGSVSESNGNIGNPQDLMASINMHEIKAKQSSYPSSESTPSISQQRQELDQKLKS